MSNFFVEIFSSRSSVGQLNKIPFFVFVLALFFIVFFVSSLFGLKMRPSDCVSRA